MKNFFANALQDLRDKRLLPVASLLVAGLVAVPVLLAKPAKDDGAAPATATASAPNEATRALVALAEEDSGTGSTLKLFNPRDPFAPGGVKNLQSLQSSLIGQASTQVASANDSSPADSGAASADTGGSETPSSGGGSTGGGDTGGGDTGGGDTGGGDKPTTAQYTYVIDVTFTKDGRRRHVDGMQRLDMLPSESAPLLMFLGVSSGGDDAAFLVDSTLDATGEGHCSPSASECGVLTIGAGSVEKFTDGDGRAYELRIDEIRKVKLSAARALTSAPRSSTRSSGDDTVRSSHRFELPDLIDILTVASPAQPSSSSNRDSR